MAHRTQRTNAQRGGVGNAPPKVASDYVPGVRPYVEVTEASRIAPGHGAEFSDMRDREAWGKTLGRRGAAYRNLLCIPDRVAPGDKGTANRIYQDILIAVEKGGWTGSEWRRLHALEAKWAARASGADVGFMLRGWQKQGSGHHTPPIEKFFKQMKGVVGHVGVHSGDR